MAEFAGTPTPKYLTWSPGSTHLFSVRQDGTTSAFVVDIGKELPLPLPKATHLPSGQPYWWYGDEVIFHDGRRFHAWLDIDVLRVGEIETSPKWKSRTELNTAPTGMPEATLPNTTRCRLSVGPVITDYMSPQYRQPSWETNWLATLTIEDRLSPRSQAIKEVDIVEGDRVVGADDGSKLIRIRDGVAEVIYFGIENERPASAYAVAVPRRTQSESFADFFKQLDSQSSCVFICPPLVNPLNSEVVGPDRDHVRGIARVLSWENEEAVIWMAEGYAQIAEGDVAAEPHIWVNSEPTSLESPFGEFWWAELGEVDGDDADLKPRDDAVPYDRQWSLTLTPSNGTATFTGLTYPVVSQQAPQPAPIVIAPKPNLPKPPAAAPPPAPQVPAEKVIEAFLKQHMQDHTKRNVPGIVDDYVNIFDRSAPRPVRSGFGSQGPDRSEKPLVRNVCDHWGHHHWEAAEYLPPV